MTQHAAAPTDNLDDLFRLSVAAHAQPFWPVVDTLAPAVPRLKAIVHVYEGAGTSFIGARVVRGKRGDTVGSTYLFRYDDRPLITALRAYRSDEGHG